MLNRDLIRFQHMLESAKAAISQLSERKRIELEQDRLLLNGVVRELKFLVKLPLKSHNQRNNSFQSCLGGK